jgi:hypothetical protein
MSPIFLFEIPIGCKDFEKAPTAITKELLKVPSTM